MGDKDLEQQYRRPDGSLDLMKCLRCDYPLLLVQFNGCGRVDCPFEEVADE